MQPHFQYDSHTLIALRSSVSPERLLRYEGIAAGDSAQALRLYMWNTALSESLYGPIQGLEVTLRNKIHRRFTDQFSACWYDDARVGLQYAQRDQILRAKLSLQHQGKPLDPLLRKDVHRVLDEIRFLRNRVAHHEPILQRALTQEHVLVLRAIAWLCTATTSWVAHHSRFNVVYSARP